MTQSFANSIAAEVRAELARRGLTAQALGDTIGVSQPQASRRLRGDIEFRPSELEKIAAWLEVPVTRFVERAGAGQ